MLLKTSCPLLVLMAINLVAINCSGQSSTRLSKEAVASIDKAIATQMKQQQLVGVAVGIVQDGKVVLSKGYGFSDRENKVEVSDKTLFRWASISKPVTAVAAMILVEDGKLDLDEDVRTYVPEFPDKGVKITARQLLCHQSGIVHYSNGRLVANHPKYETNEPFEDVILALAKFKDSPLVYQPREKYSYSTHAYILLSAVVQRAAKQKFADYVDQVICEPLELKTLQPDYQWDEIPNRAIGYRQNGRGVAKSTDTDVSWKLGGGGFISNVGDLARFAAAMCNGKLLSEKTYKEMWTNQKTSDGATTNLGLGFFLAKENGQLKVSHNGSQEKTKTRMVFYPKSKFGVVVMTNSEHANPGRITTAVIQALK